MAAAKRLAELPMNRNQPRSEQRMRLSTRTHGYVDYALGAMIIAMPWVLGFGPTVAGWTAVGLGIGLVINALLTNFEAGAVRLMEVPVHLWIDGTIGLLL